MIEVMFRKEKGQFSATHHYEPFGVELEPFGNNTTDNKYRFTGQERDHSTNFDYMHFRFYGSSMGRFLRPDPFPGKTTDVQSWNLYSYVKGNPVNMIDPLGLDWYRIEGKWQWRPTHGKIKWMDSKGKTHTAKDYRYYITFEKTGVNKEGAAIGKLTLYDQNKPLVVSQAFSGGKGFNIIPSGTYWVNIANRGKADSSNALKENQQELKQFYGIQEIAPTITNKQGVVGSARWEWGSIQVALNEEPGETRAAYLGNYLHGKESPGDYTHSCVCERSEQVLKTLLKINYRKNPVIPMEVK